MEPPAESVSPNFETPLAALHRAAGAEFSTYFGVRLPARFGDPSQEYRCARETVALIDTNYRAVFSLTGPDRTRYLNAVLTSNIRDLPAGRSAIGLLLNAQGHILGELEALAFDDHLLILGHKFVGERTAQTLDKLIIMDDATLSDQTAETGTVAVEGPAARDLLRDVTGVDLASLAPGEHLAVDVATSAGAIPCRLLHRGLYGWPGAEFLAPIAALAGLWETLAAAAGRHGGAPIGYRALDALRLEAGIPWFGVDFDERAIPHETGLETTHISFTKGCYPGQEIVERVRSRGHVNRRLTGLAFGGQEIPAHGAPLVADGTEAGQVTSAAFSPLLGKPLGFGYVRREHNQAGQKLQCGAAITEVIGLPLEGALPLPTKQP